MSLFPAYGTDGDESIKSQDTKGLKRQWTLELEPEAQEEAVLLASDSEEQAPPAVATLPTPATSEEAFYIDKKADNANLRVTTLYYPGRPIYRRAHGARAEGGRARRRYHLQAAAAGDGGGSAAQARERAGALRRLLAERPRDEELWLRYVHFQEEWADAAAWRDAAEEARRGGADGPRLRAALHAARAAALAPRDLLAAVSEDVAHEKREEVRLEGWLRLLWTLGGAGGSPAEVERAAAAALHELQHAERAYPLLLYAAGATLRAAGLWERLVLLLELVMSVSAPASAGFPPPRAPDETRAADRRLRDAEDAVIDSGLPLSTVWVRVERLRAAAHWRAGEGGGGDAGGDEDPQRAPAAAELAPLLRAVRPGGALLLSVCALRLAQVPLLPASQAARRACAAGAHEPAEPAPAALCALARAARRLPRAPLPAPALRAALAALVDPPHVFGDDAGYGAWVSALWEASCAAHGARGRLALVCWRLRWLHALQRAAAPGEARRVRAQARRLIKRHAPAEPLAFALFARIEAEAGDGEGARRVALQAVRAATSREHALYAARVLRELVGEREPAARRALLAAVHARPPPPPPALHTAPSPAELLAALQECSERCAEVERRLGEAGEGEGSEEAVARALTCGAGEWAAARVSLLAPAERAAELARLLALSHETVHRSAESVQYWESLAVSLAEAAGAARRGVARQLRPLFPDNALLALASSGWEECGRVARTHVGALAQALPALARAPWGGGGGGGAGEWERVARACARAARGGAGGAALWALRLEAEARAERTTPRAHRALLAALCDHPNDKWLYVRGAGCACAEAGALGDALLERGLRAHALLHELAALNSAPAGLAAPDRGLAAPDRGLAAPDRGLAAPDRAPATSSGYAVI